MIVQEDLAGRRQLLRPCWRPSLRPSLTSHCGKHSKYLSSWLKWARLLQTSKKVSISSPSSSSSHSGLSSAVLLKRSRLRLVDDSEELAMVEEVLQQSSLPA